MQHNMRSEGTRESDEEMHGATVNTIDACRPWEVSSAAKPQPGIPDCPLGVECASHQTYMVGIAIDDLLHRAKVVTMKMGL